MNDPARGFTCPLCGVHVANPHPLFETVLVDERPMVRLWDGGPSMPDPAEMVPVRRVVDQVLSTRGCACRFKLSEWQVSILSYPDGTSALVVLPRLIEE